MTKKEQAAMQAAIHRADTLAALRWTSPVQRDVDVPPAASRRAGRPAGGAGGRMPALWIRGRDGASDPGQGGAFPEESMSLQAVSLPRTDNGHLRVYCG